MSNAVGPTYCFVAYEIEIRVDTYAPPARSSRLMIPISVGLPPPVSPGAGITHEPRPVFLIDKYKRE